MRCALLAVSLFLVAAACDSMERLPASGVASVVTAGPSSAITSCRVADGRADRRCTPGALNPNVSQANIYGTICVPGWTATIRPPAGYTNRLKREQKIAYGETALTDAQLEEDHLVSLSAGGSPNDPRNLFPQPWPDAHRKDTDEHRVNRDICAGRVTLQQGQAQLLSKWSR